MAYPRNGVATEELLRALANFVRISISNNSPIAKANEFLIPLAHKINECDQA
jgi:hypothetical protein